MSDDIGLTITYKEGVRSIGADKVLKAARQVHILLREIEKSQSGKRARIKWDVTIFPQRDRTYIGFSAINGEGRAIATLARQSPLFGKKHQV